VEADDEMHREEDPDESYAHRRRHWMKHWMRHTAIVPKGFLRHQLLKMLSEKPMSGSEIMSDLERQTNGYWKPSPGSIYPLLAWLQDKGHIKEADQKEPGIRRYTLTEQGKTFLETEAKSREELDRRLEHFGPASGSFGPMWFGFDREDVRELRKVGREFGRAVRDVFHEMRREHSKEAIEQAMRTLEEATKKLQDITRKLQEQGTD
jgi:DNA-binding PadR family transcriptional regulator